MPARRRSVSRRIAVAKRTLSFYECLDDFGARVPQISWADILNVIENLNAAGAVYTARDASSYHGRVYRSRRGVDAFDLLVVSKIRERGWPSQFLGGRYSDLQLPSGAALAESTHVAFFDRNVAAVMRGAEAPFPARIESYLMDKVDFGENALLLKPLLHPDVSARMANAEYVRKFTMKLPSSQAEQLPAGARTLRRILRVTRERYGSVEVELTIKIPTTGADQESDRMLGEIQAIIDAGTLSILEKAKMTFVDRTSDVGAELDFLNERLAMTVEVELSGKSNTVQDASAADALWTSYDALKGTIELIVPAIAA